MKPLHRAKVTTKPATNAGASPSEASQSLDPVCGMVVFRTATTSRAEHNGQSYYFCCTGCKTTFLADPAQFVHPTAKPAPSTPSSPSVSAAPGAIYTCPMHPQVRRDDPGNCPICGMTLEPEGIPEPEGTSPELKDMSRRFVIGAIPATPIFVLEMGGYLPQRQWNAKWFCKKSRISPPSRARE
jgi:P-type Cu+ transporter